MTSLSPVPPRNKLIAADAARGHILEINLGMDYTRDVFMETLRQGQGWQRFKTESLVDFHRNFDGHLFKSKTGAEFQAVVEFAPYQKTPVRAKIKADSRQGTIDNDPDYESFLERLNAPIVKAALETTIPPPQSTSTPLLDHLRIIKATKSKSKGKTAEQPRKAALAAVSKAAADRAPKDGNVIMVAGKGRGVAITPVTNNAPSGASKGNKKGKKKTADPKTEATRPQSPGGVAAEGQNRGQPRADRGGGSRGGRGGGRGGAKSQEGMSKSAHDTVVGILNKNNADRGRGGVRGGVRGAGRGRGVSGRGGTASTGAQVVSSISASQARIDM